MSEDRPGVLTRRSEHIMEVRLHRPDRRNAITHAMYDALAGALEAAEADPAIRVVLLAGDADCFTAGNDMQDFLDHPPADADSPVVRFLMRLAAGTKPLVAAVNGPAIGIGTTVLLHCDLVFIGRSARLQMPFVSLGLCPEAGSSLLLPRLAGYQRAAELLLLGEPFDAAQAHEIGLANAVVDDAECIDHARTAARRLATRPPAAVRASRALLRRGLGEELEERIRTEADLFARRLQSPEAREALRAFVEKREPDFSAFE